jgi:2-alkenal reductase
MDWKRVLYAFTLIAVAGISALSGAVAGGVAVYSAIQPLANSPQPMQTLATSSTEVQSPVQLSTTEFETTITQAVERVGPSVVTVIGILPGQTTFFGRAPDQTVSGSGVIISEEGYVLTNNHVVEDTKEVAIILADGTELPASIVGSDVFSDLAVLQAKGKMPAVASLGNSDALRPGETVIAIGSPLGDFKNTVTLGVVSATERTLDTGQGYQMEGLVQTDAAINQGNSGGPLINLAGEVIGINTIIVRGRGFGGPVAEGLGFAIPVNTAKAVSNQIVEKGYFSYPYLGIRWQWISKSIAQRYDLPVKSGAYISFVEPGSPADEAGLQPDDIIVKIGDRILNEDNPFINSLYSYSPGEEVVLDVVRGGNHIKISVTLEERPAPSQ